MKKRQPCIYKITNLVDGKVYIGQTTVGFEKRIREHLYKLRNDKHKNEHLQRAYNKFGETNFVFEILQECEIKEIDSLECYWIELFESTDRSYGYNFENGGNKNKKHHAETLTKLSELSKRNWENPIYLKKMAERIERMTGSKNPAAIKVICVNDGKIFDALSEAAEYYNISNKYISRVCKGERYSTNGLQFAHYEEGKKYELKETPIYEKGNHPTARKIICINENKVFDSVVEASEFYKISYDNIHQVVLGKNIVTKTPDGHWYQFAYYEEGKKYKLKKFDETKIKKPKKVVCINTGQTFESICQAANHFGLQQSKISLVCSGKRNYHGKTESGEKLKWAFV